MLSQDQLFPPWQNHCCQGNIGEYVSRRRRRQKIQQNTDKILKMSYLLVFKRVCKGYICLFVRTASEKTNNCQKMYWTPFPPLLTKIGGRAATKNPPLKDIFAASFQLFAEFSATWQQWTKWSELSLELAEQEEDLWRFCLPARAAGSAHFFTFPAPDKIWFRLHFRLLQYFKTCYFYRSLR